MSLLQVHSMSNSAHKFVAVCINTIIMSVQHN